MASLRVDGRFIVFLAGVLSPIVWGSSGFRQYVPDSNFENMICSGPQLLFNVRSDRFRCVLTCYQNALCKAVFFNNVSRTCDGFSETMSNSSVCTSQLGTEYIVLNKVPYGEECGGRVGCLGNNMECWDMVCTCNPGYKYQPRDNLCVAGSSGSTGCTDPTYQAYSGYKMKGCLIKAFFKATLETCLAACTNDNGCYGFNQFGSSTFADCYLKSCSPETHISDFRADPNSILHQNNCE